MELLLYTFTYFILIDLKLNHDKTIPIKFDKIFLSHESIYKKFLLICYKLQIIKTLSSAININICIFVVITIIYESI